MPRKTLFLIIGLVIATVILFIVALRAGEKQKQVIQPKTITTPTPTPFAFTTLTLSPNPVEVASGKQGSIDVEIDTQTNQVTAVQLELIYDPIVISNVKIIPSDLIANPIVLINKNDIKTGRITYAFGIQPGQKTVKGIGTIATITFTAKGQVGSESYLTLLPTTLVTAQGVPNSVLKTSNSTIVNVVSSAAATPSTTISPTQ